MMITIPMPILILPLIARKRFKMQRGLCSSSQNRSFPRSPKHFSMDQWNDVSMTLVPFYNHVHFSLPGRNSLVFPVDSEEKFFIMPKEKCSDCEQLNVFKEVLLSTEALKPKLDRCLKVSFFFSFYTDKPSHIDILSICPRLKANYFRVLNPWFALFFVSLFVINLVTSTSLL